MILLTPTPASLCAPNTKAEVKGATSKPHGDHRFRKKNKERVNLSPLSYAETFHTLALDEPSVMTPQMPLCGGEFSHLPSTSVESEGSIVGKEERFLEGKRGQR